MLLINLYQISVNLLIKTGIILLFVKNLKKFLLPIAEINNNLHKINGGNCSLKNNAVRQNNENHKQSGKYSPYVSLLNNVCCKKLKQTNISKSYRTNQVFKIFHNLAYKSENLIYLLKHRVFKLQYLGKSETASRNFQNNHRNDVK